MIARSWLILAASLTATALAVRAAAPAPAPVKAIVAASPSTKVSTLPASTSAPTTTYGALKSSPVPFLSPEEAASTFNLPKGLHAEVVAAEPLVQQPIAMEFDPDGRLWVVEMRGYMQDSHGKGEDEPTGRITMLEDLDGDGAMDRRTIFLDGLVMPRSVGLTGAGVLVGAPPRLLLCRDTDGDGKSDVQTTLLSDYGLRGNPEHEANGTMHALDNWIYIADYGRRLRYLDGKWVSSTVPDIGQWGICQDDFGRLFHNTNSDQLRGSLIPPHYAARNPNWASPSANAQIAADQDVWPAHDTALNRGYREGFLRNDRLAKFTGACGPVIYRGDLFPHEFYGNGFVCEPTANVIRRNVLKETGDGGISGENAYDKRDFIASTYERFRPVNLYNGPDGALYIVDMHHGLIQHKQFLTDYARKLYLDRELDKHLLTGRIYRIVPDGAKPVARPRLSQATAAQLVQQLAHPNGWWRDTAQRLLVERHDPAAIPLLRTMATSHPFALARLHALWTLHGTKDLDDATRRAALADADPKSRAAAIRMSEPKLGEEVLKLAGDANPDVRLQFVLSASALNSPAMESAVAGILRDHGENYLLRDAAISGLHGRETAMLRRIMNDASWSTSSAGRADVITDLSRAIIKSAEGPPVAMLLDMMASQTPSQAWRQVAMLEAFPDADKGKRAKKIALDVRPKALAILTVAPNDTVRERADKLAALFTWPGKPVEAEPAVIPLTAEQQARFELGKQQYATICGQCHKPDGMGQLGLAPPLVGSEWVLGSDTRLIRIVLHGLRGPINIGDKTFNLDMPSLGVLDDEKIAAALTYVRREWGHTAAAVEPRTVKDIRGATQGRKEAWSIKELQGVR